MISAGKVHPERGDVGQLGKTVGTVAVSVFFAVTATLAFLGDATPYESPELLKLLNLVFLFLLPGATALFTARFYAGGGSIALLWLGCGNLAFALSSLVAGLVLGGPGSPNPTVTIHNSGVFLSSLFHLLGVLTAGDAAISFRWPDKVRINVLPAFGAIILFTALLSGFALSGVFPDFFTKTGGPTSVRQAVLGSGLILYLASSGICIRHYSRSGEAILFWYGIGLALVAVGLAGIFLQKEVASPIGWVGRGAQYAGGVSFFLTVYVAATQARRREVPVGQVLDIAWNAAERKKAEDRLQEMRRLYEQLIDNAGDGIFSLSNEGRFLFANAAMCDMVGYGADEILSLNIADTYQEASREVAGQRMALLRRGETMRFVRPMVRKDGSLITIEATAWKAADGNIQSIVRDITERKKAEEERRLLAAQLQQAHKLESLGVLAGGVAHDFNNILQVVEGNTELVLGTVPKTSPEANFLREILCASTRGAELCRQMLAYAGKAQFVRSRVKVESLVDDTVRMLRDTLPANISVELDLGDGIPEIEADRSHISQLVTNLVLNAVEAIGDGQGVARVSLGTSLVGDGSDEKDVLGRRIPPGLYAILKVADNGCGMSDDVRDHLFDPFFTTKFPGRGLGLPAVLGVVTAHGGAIRVDSRPGLGTTVEIYLPSVEPAAPVAEAPGIEVAPVRGSGTVLLVEDEPSVLRLGAMMLKRVGLEVVEAKNGLEALEAYRRNAAAFALVITDLDMPVMDGYALIAELRKSAPGLPVVVSSGYGDLANTGKLPKDGVAGRIDKPYRFAQLEDVLKNVLTRPAAPPPTTPP